MPRALFTLAVILGVVVLPMQPQEQPLKASGHYFVCLDRRPGERWQRLSRSDRRRPCVAGLRASGDDRRHRSANRTHSSHRIHAKKNEERDRRTRVMLTPCNPVSLDPFRVGKNQNSPGCQTTFAGKETLFRCANQDTAGRKRRYPGSRADRNLLRARSRLRGDCD